MQTTKLEQAGLAKFHEAWRRFDHSIINLTSWSKVMQNFYQFSIALSLPKNPKTYSLTVCYLMTKLLDDLLVYR